MEDPTYLVVDDPQTGTKGFIESRIRRSDKQWKNPIELARAIDSYIASIHASKQLVKKKSGEEIVVFDKNPSLAGLCLHLGLPSKMAYKALCMDSNRYLSKVAVAGLTWLESHYVESMQAYGAAVSSFQFLLSNMGYKSENIFKPESVPDRTVPPELSMRDSEAPSTQHIQISFVASPDAKETIQDVLAQQENPDTITIRPEPAQIETKQQIPEE